MILKYGGQPPSHTNCRCAVLLIPTKSPLASVLGSLPRSIDGLPVPGTPEFERMIATTTAAARSRALPDQREQVSPEQQAERDQADALLASGSERLDAIERAIANRRASGEVSQ